MTRDASVRRWYAADVVGARAPGLVGAAMLPMARRMAAGSGAGNEAVRRDLRALPLLLDHADELIDAGVLGSDEPNAADFQVLASVRVLLEAQDIAQLVEGRPCATAARRLLPRWIGPVPALSVPLS